MGQMLEDFISSLVEESTGRIAPSGMGGGSKGQSVRAEWLHAPN